MADQHTFGKGCTLARGPAGGLLAPPTGAASMTENSGTGSVAALDCGTAEAPDACDVRRESGDTLVTFLRLAGTGSLSSI